MVIKGVAIDQGEGCLESSLVAVDMAWGTLWKRVFSLYLTIVRSFSGASAPHLSSWLLVSIDPKNGVINIVDFRKSPSGSQLEYGGDPRAGPLGDFLKFVGRLTPKMGVGSCSMVHYCSFATHPAQATHPR